MLQLPPPPQSQGKPRPFSTLPPCWEANTGSLLGCGKARDPPNDYDDDDIGEWWSWWCKELPVEMILVRRQYWFLPWMWQGHRLACLCWCHWEQKKRDRQTNKRQQQQSLLTGLCILSGRTAESRHMLWPGFLSSPWVCFFIAWYYLYFMVQHCILTPRIRYSSCSCSVTEKPG